MARGLRSAVPVAALSLLIGAGALVSGQAVPPAEPLVLGALPLLVADDSGLASRTGVVRTIHAARTRSAPVIAADQPWEGQRVYVYGSVLREAATGELRMWYGTRPKQESREAHVGEVAGLRGDGFDLVLYATSKDGVAWTKPNVGLHAFRGSTANNILFDLHSPSILEDVADPDVSKRYKMLGTWQGNYYAAHSADGLRWTSYPKNPVLSSSDTITMTRDPRTKAYLAYHKRPASVRGFPRRVVWLSRSPDMQTWSEPELVFVPDEIDDQWTSTPVERTEVYNMSVFPHASGFLGLPTILRVTNQLPRDQVAPGQSPIDGPIDVELATSADGRTWRRTSRREVIIPRGAPGTFDGGAILGVASTPVHTDDQTWVYYTAITTGHGAPIGPKRISIGRAEWRRHGFASLDAGPDGGRVETKPVRLTGSSLEVNADARRGCVRLALLEADGRPLAGFGLDDAVPLEVDATRWQARWKSSVPAPTDRPLRVRVELTSARLYSLSAE